MRTTVALSTLAAAATLVEPALASSLHGGGALAKRAHGRAAETGMVRRMVRRVRRASGAGAAVLSLPSNSSSTTTAASSSSSGKQQYESTAIWWAEAGWIGSCGEVISDTDLVLALPYALYPDPSTVSPLCGTSVLVSSPSTAKSLTARVVGASDRQDYTAFSKAAFEQLGGDLEGGELAVVLQLVDGKAATGASSVSSTVGAGAGAGKVAASQAATASSSSAAPVKQSPARAAPTTPTTSQAAKTPAQAPTTTTKAATATATTTTTSSWDSASAAAASKSKADAAWASSSSASAAAAAASKSSADAAWASSSSAAAYKMWASSSSAAAAAAASKSSADAAWASSSSAAAAAASKSSADAAWASSSSAAAAKATQASSSGSSGSSGGKVFTGGIATFFYQNGVAGNCGQVNSDDSYIVALPTSTYADGSHCGQSVKITRSDTGQSITAKVADSCPTCNNNSCLDLSVGAFKALGGTDAMGVFDITWQFV